MDWCRAQEPWHTARQQMASQTAVTLEARWLAHMKGKHVSDIWQGYAWVSLPSAKQGNKPTRPTVDCASRCLIATIHRQKSSVLFMTASKSILEH